MVLRFLFWLDAGLNVLTGGHYLHTISGRIGYFSRTEGGWFWESLEALADLPFKPLQRHHCAWAADIEVNMGNERTFDQGGYFGRFLVVLIVLIGMLPIGLGCCAWWLVESLKEYSKEK